MSAVTVTVAWRHAGTTHGGIALLRATGQVRRLDGRRGLLPNGRRAGASGPRYRNGERGELAGLGRAPLQVCRAARSPLPQATVSNPRPSQWRAAGLGGTVAVIPGPSQISGVDLPGLLALVITLVVVLAPLLLGRRASPGQSDPEPGDGRGGGPRRPCRPPDSPWGGIPLEDAEPGRVRLRNPDRLSDGMPRRSRRGSRAPVRPPTRTFQTEASPELVRSGNRVLADSFGARCQSRAGVAWLVSRGGCGYDQRRPRSWCGRYLRSRSRRRRCGGGGAWRRLSGGRA
jgi:hypothetical protein